jgi:hypothetical protein
MAYDEVNVSVFSQYALQVHTLKIFEKDYLQICVSNCQLNLLGWHSPSSASTDNYITQYLL